MKLENPKKTIQIYATVFFFCFIVAFALFNSRELILGVKIKNVNIQNWSKISENVLNITGNAKHSINLKLNGREISIDKQGNFDETIVLLPGYNIVNIRAEDKFKHVDEKNYQLMY